MKMKRGIAARISVDATPSMNRNAWIPIELPKNM